MPRRYLILIYIALLAFFLTPQKTFCQASSRNGHELAVWVSVFSASNALTSRSGADKLIDFCETYRIKEIYLQVYRSDMAYYDTEFLERDTFERISASFGEDPVNYIIEEARARGIKVHLWMNALSIARNTSSEIVARFGEEVLTLDQHGRTPLIEERDELDKYYIRENQLFLEPGNEDVIEYIVNVARDIVQQYPRAAGIQLDYIRYPAVVPFIPGARFATHGLSYGYTDTNIDTFRSLTGTDPGMIRISRQEAWEWDQFRRDNVTRLVKEISKVVDRNKMKLTCTTVPSAERSYAVTFQQWRDWLEKDLVDEVIFMNYTEDTALSALNSQTMAIEGLRDKLVMGLGPYLFKDKKEIFRCQLESSVAAGFEKTAFFAYDHLMENEDFQEILRDF